MDSYLRLDADMFRSPSKSMLNWMNQTKLIKYNL